LGSEELRLPLVIDLKDSGESAVIRVSGQKVRLLRGAYSEWIELTFRAGLRRITGICRFYLVSVAPEFRLYVTPINISPERPSMPISHPSYYSVYLAKLHGPYATLGLAEDTWALNEGIIDDGAYLRQVYDVHEERERMLFDALKRVLQGLCVCVFDLPDRIQHMFLRSEDADNAPAAGTDEEGDAIDEAYRRADGLLGRVMDAIDRDTVLFVMSDHGVVPFRRGVHLNAWLRESGYLALKPGATGGEYLAGIDWGKTTAYSFGLSGIYLNVKGREARGVLSREQAKALKSEIAGKLSGLKDPETGEAAVSRVYDSAAVYSGPYADNGPDLVVGYADGYRASWEAAVGKTDGEIFTDNTRAWSGDHCVDHALVPGVLFCNRKMNGRRPHIMDIAPTILTLFGISVPGYMDGKSLFEAETRSHQQAVGS